MDETVFKSYDIRGLYPKQIDDSFAYFLGRAVATIWDHKIVVGGDARTSTPALREQLIDGLVDSGAKVIDIGLSPTPMLSFAVKHLGASLGINITASHNPSEYNGFKFYDPEGRVFTEFDKIKKLMNSSAFKNCCGKIDKQDISDDYTQFLTSKISLPLNVKIVADFGNAVPAAVYPKVFEKAGIKVSPLFSDLDGTFPNHAPDPSREKNLVDLKKKVKEVNADFGFGFDGDGDRMGAVDSNGNIILAEEILAVIIKNILKKKPNSSFVRGCLLSNKLITFTENLGGRLVTSKVGHKNVKQKARETNSQVGGETSGHFFFREINYSDDACFAVLKLLETLQTTSLDEIRSEFPKYHSAISRDNRIPFPGNKQEFIDKLIQRFKDHKIDLLDGVRVIYPKGGWLLVRSSHTEPILVYAYESPDKTEFEELKSIMENIITEINE